MFRDNFRSNGTSGQNKKYYCLFVSHSPAKTKKTDCFYLVYKTRKLVSSDPTLICIILASAEKVLTGKKTLPYISSYFNFR
jgi:hypothetical protein